MNGGLQGIVDVSALFYGVLYASKRITADQESKPLSGKSLVDAVTADEVRACSKKMPWRKVADKTAMVVLGR